MSFGAELRARLGLDTSAWRTGLAQAGRAADTFGEGLTKKISLRDATRSFVAGIGISIESIAEKIAEAWVGGTKAGFEKIRELHEEIARLEEQRRLSNLPDDQARIAELKRLLDAARSASQEGRRSKTVTTTSGGGTDFAGIETTATVFTESEQDYEIRRAESLKRAAELEGQLDSAKRKDKTEIKALDQQLDSARQSRIMAELELEDRLSFLIGLRAAAEMRVDEAKEGSADRTKAQIEVEKLGQQIADARRATEEKMARYRDERARDNQQLADEEKRRDEDSIRRALKLADLRAKLTDALGDRNRAAGELAAARGDAYRISLGDAAAGQGGATGSQRSAARRIQSLEARAQRIFLRGGDYRDAAGNAVSAEGYAQGLMSRAAGMRKDAGFLKSSDRDPFAAQLEQLKKSEEHLAEIREALQPGPPKDEGT